MEGGEDGVKYKFADNEWRRVEKGDEEKISKTEGQIWIGLFHLLMDGRCQEKYEINSSRKMEANRVQAVGGLSLDNRSRSTPTGKAMDGYVQLRRDREFGGAAEMRRLRRTSGKAMLQMSPRMVLPARVPSESLGQAQDRLRFAERNAGKRLIHKGDLQTFGTALK